MSINVLAAIQMVTMNSHFFYSEKPEHTEKENISSRQTIDSPVLFANPTTGLK